jgi:hypothetical protein
MLSSLKEKISSLKEITNYLETLENKKLVFNNPNIEDFIDMLISTCDNKEKLYLLQNLISAKINEVNIGNKFPQVLEDTYFPELENEEFTIYNFATNIINDVYICKITFETETKIITDIKYIY